jgi:hypothetical protein
MCPFSGATFIAVSPSVAQKPQQVHEFMVLCFRPGVDADRQALVMEVLDAHFARCPGLRSREYFRNGDGQWVKHLVWATQGDLDTSSALEDDPVVAELFAHFDSETVAYACCERFEPDGEQQLSGTAPMA